MSNNYGFARFVAALFVICGHAISLSTGEVTNFSLYSGRYAVAFFFFGGGFFLTKSLRQKGCRGFWGARIKKILPELMICVALTVFILGPIVTSLSVKEYFIDKRTYLYLLNSFCVLVHDLPGVFTQNVYTSTVNGALWTLPVEVLCYAGVYILGKADILTSKKILFTMPFLGVGIGAILFLFRGNAVLLNAVVPICMFYIGGLCQIYQDKIKISNVVLYVAVIGLILLQAVGGYYIGVFCFYPYIILCLINIDKQVAKQLGKLGDYSYAMYLVGFPIQQAVVHAFGGQMNPIFNMIISIPIDICLAILIYRINQMFMMKKETI